MTMHLTPSTPSDSGGLPPARGLWRARAQGRLRSLWRRERLWLAPGPEALALPPVVDTVNGHAVLLGPDPTAMLSAWAAWCARHPGACCEIALSSHWVWAMTSQDPVDLAEQRIASARAVWAEASGVSADVLADQMIWRALPAGEPPLVCALPRTLMERLLTVATPWGVSIERLTPWWLPAAQGWWAKARGAADEADVHVVAREPSLGVHFRIELSSSGGKELAVWSEWPRAEGEIGDASVLVDVFRDAGSPPGACLAPLSDPSSRSFTRRWPAHGKAG